ncbi:B3 domain-containing protein LFL1 [Argentina anserina]|uniref:B3 domain-containing protein LFL1 n=1 Tax=Argentina anserina TaxID=57926 RepID=UPI00217690CF|nr:B3 domain-containing protein LFL1-like [Potentilla anserina]
MENFRPPFTSSTTTTSSTSPSSTLERSSSLLYHGPAVGYMPTHPLWQQPPNFVYPPPMCPFPVPSAAVMDDARIVRQRRSHIMRTKKAARAAAASSRLVVQRDIPPSAGPETQNKQHDYSFCTPDNKKLRLLFKKELKNSDVGSLGRIVLPKKEAEKYLPSLSDKDGIELRIRDALSTQEWDLRYKYWTNNKSRMYVLENTGDFVRQSGVEVGDSIHLYVDESRNHYVSIHRLAEARPLHVFQPSSTLYHQQNYTDTNTITNVTAIENTEVYRNGEDETSSAAVLRQQQRNLEQVGETNYNMLTLFTDPASSYRQTEEANNSNNDVTRQKQTPAQPAMAGIFGSSSSPSSSTSIVKMSEDNFGDFYEGLGMLPEVHRFEHSLFDIDDIIRDDKLL